MPHQLLHWQHIQADTAPVMDIGVQWEAPHFDAGDAECSDREAPNASNKTIEGPASTKTTSSPDSCTLIRQRQGNRFLDTVYCHPIAATATAAKLLELLMMIVEIPAQLGEPDSCCKLLNKLVAHAIGCRR